MKRSIFFMLVALSFIMLSCQSEHNGLIPVTAKTEKAVDLYYQAYTALTDINVPKFEELISQVMQEDSNFFMANYLMISYEANFRQDSVKAREYAEKAASINTKLSAGEGFLQRIVKLRLDNMQADVTDLAKGIIAQYPKDFWGYYELANYQGLMKDFEGQIETIKTAAERSDKAAFAYNYLGYTYLSNEKYNEAAAAFDKYIELSPEIPNPYDSKGDYFMAVKEYQKAYDSYMKAHEIDTLWGVKKAEKAKMMLDSTSTQI